MSPERKSYLIVESKAEQTRGSIEREVKAFKEENGKGWGMAYFNNFFLHFSNGKQTLITPRHMLQTWLPEAWDKTYKENMNAQEHDNYSKYYLERTPAQFYSDIDKTTQEKGISTEKIWQLKKEGKMDELYEYVLPVYIELREKGYQHYKDLTA